MVALLVPVHLDAKVVAGEAVDVLRLESDPFAEPDDLIRLGLGVHLRWALPDALTRAQTFQLESGAYEAVFPAVPDQWLIVRYQPLTEKRKETVTEAPKLTSDALRAPLISSIDPERGDLEVFSARRACKAWVLDSRTGVSTPLADWSSPNTGHGADVLTAVGPLPEHGDRPGWGRWDARAAEPEPLGANYYPRDGAPRRFGFHDVLDDLPDGSGGTFSYAVVGWYANRQQDPLHRAHDREALVRAWMLSAKDPDRSERTVRPELLAELLGEVGTQALKSVRVESVSADVAKRLGALARRLPSLAPSPRFEIDAAALGGVEALKPGMAELLGPTELVCHGAVVEVPRVPSEAPGDVGWRVDVAPSLRQAIADVVTPGSGWNPIMTEALLEDIDAQATTPAGLVGVPAALHALSFVSAPGQSRWCGQLIIRPGRKISVESIPRLGVTSFESKLSRAKISAFGKLTPPEQGRASSEQPPSKPPPYEPTEDEINDCRSQLVSALASALEQAGGRVVHPRRLRVLDTRKQAQPGRLAPLSRGSDGASWWLDIENPEQIRSLLLATHGSSALELPSAATLFEEPGPRWYRPSAPHVTVEQIGRGCAHGYDHRYESDGTLRCRLAGATLSGAGIALAGAPQANAVPGSAVLGLSILLGSGDLPPVARPLLEEVTLLDPGNAGLLADNWQHRYASAALDRTKVEEAFRAQALTWMANPAQELSLRGRAPSPVALALWDEPWLPLFAWVKVSHDEADMGAHYELGEVELELAQPFPSGAGTSHTERAYLSSAVARVLQGKLIDCLSIDPQGNVIPRGPKLANAVDFERYDMLSLGLAGIDEWLYTGGERQRSGSLTIEGLEVVDVFGTRRSWAPELSATDIVDTELSPRLPYWARLMCRFVSSTDAHVEADATLGHSPISGFLVPDFVEHAIEVFDAKGRALGQLVSGHPHARFVPHPWVPVPSPGDALSVIADTHLREFVVGVTAQAAESVGNEPEPEGSVSTAMAGLTRVINAISGTIDKSDKLGDKRIRMFGRLITVARVDLWFETTASDSAPKSTPSQQPPSVPDHPPIRVQIGASSQPDDGVYGVFVPNADPRQSRFAPVSEEVLGSTPAHSFVTTLAQSEVTLGPGERRSLTVLLDVQCAMHLTSGVLPRKKLTLPQDITKDALTRIEPTIRVGPVLAVPRPDGLRPLLPYPDLPDYEERWVEEPAAGVSKDDPEAWTETTPSRLPNPGAVPTQTVELTRGWMRFEPQRAQIEPEGS